MTFNVNLMLNNVKKWFSGILYLYIVYEIK